MTWSKTGGENVKVERLQKLISPNDGEAFASMNVDGSSPVLLVCEHACAEIPRKLGSLGLSEDALKSHIAWDIGALAVARQLAAKLDAALAYQRFSRLVYDCNRPPEASSAIPVKSEVFEIPGNKNLDDKLRRERVDEIYRPFQVGLTSLIRERAEMGRPTIVVTVHSYTPVYFGKTREVEVGILHDSDSRFADRILLAAEAAGTYKTLRNQPYGPEDGVTHTLVEHAQSAGLLNVMIEMRNDLVAQSDGQEAMSDFLAAVIRQCLPSGSSSEL